MYRCAADRCRAARRSGDVANGTRDVSLLGNAIVLTGRRDYDLDGFAEVRDLFPGRHVTLDGDVITVWPPTQHTDHTGEDGDGR
ncbi:hypothetical protein [Streptomyces sp. NPDC058045]|uniref:hypothetical protein n=1 Tax=Streptomyces sp. NPDC058045 TaxID=3346311 RepID=UPI0036EB0F29